MLETLQTEYKGYSINSVKEEERIYWTLYFGGRFILTDCRTIDGSPFQSAKNAENDAKKNIDIFIRLGIAD